MKLKFMLPIFLFLTLSILVTVSIPVQAMEAMPCCKGKEKGKSHLTDTSKPFGNPKGCGCGMSGSCCNTPQNPFEERPEVAVFISMDETKLESTDVVGEINARDPSGSGWRVLKRRMIRGIGPPIPLYLFNLSFLC